MVTFQDSYNLIMGFSFFKTRFMKDGIWYVGHLFCGYS